MHAKKMLASLPAWALVLALVTLGSGTTWGGCCGGWNYNYQGCCDSPEIDIDQKNYGNGYNRTNFADADIQNGWYYGRGGEIEVDQENVGNGNYRDNIAFTNIDAGKYGGGYGTWGWGYKNCCADNEIDIDQENYGNGNYRDNAAYATWSW